MDRSKKIKVDLGQRTTLWTKTKERACGARNFKLTKTRERERGEMVGEEGASECVSNQRKVWIRMEEEERVSIVGEWRYYGSRVEGWG